jgi:hypothetical protein
MQATRASTIEMRAEQRREALERRQAFHRLRQEAGARLRARLKTAEGLMEYAAPQIAGQDEPFRCNLVAMGCSFAACPSPLLIRLAVRLPASHITVSQVGRPRV